ncbi:transglutaminase-like domain-containing protein [Myxococcota bacterium]|nr:transglutaminase-like domain-containing protein [Myxococcota bacterium]
MSQRGAPSEAVASRPTGRAGAEQRAARIWDVIGLLTLALFATTLWTMNRGASRRVEAEAAALAPGAEIRAGDEWIGLYFQDRKIGLTRITKAPDEGGGWTFRVHSTLKLDTLGVAAQAELDLRARLGATRALRGFELALRTGAQDFRGEGTVEGDALRLLLNTGGERIERTLPLPAPPVLRDLLGPVIAQGPLTPGRRLSLPGFDPWTLSATPVEIEIIGPDTLVLMGQTLPATRIRQRLDGLTLDAWINERGEMLRQELPLGLVALRQSEEEARWGMADEGGVSLADAVELPVAPLPPPDARARRLVLRWRGPGQDLLAAPPAQILERERLVRTPEPPATGRPLPVRLEAQDTELAAALRADGVVQADHKKIRERARMLQGDARDTLTAARAIATALHRELRFERRGGLPSALETLESGAGDCTEVSVLFAALARAAGIPTRLVFGLVYKPEPTPRFAWHAWNEVAVEGGFVSVDATWGQSPVDLTHIALARGDFRAQIDLLRIMGHVSLEFVEAE